MKGSIIVDFSSGDMNTMSVLSLMTVLLTNKLNDVENPSIESMINPNHHVAEGQLINS